jgi:uncharacterized protein YbjT (DUF2867 family)
MRVLVAGATGFIGRRLVDALLARGHEAIGAARHGAPVRVDYARDHAASDWLPRLQRIDAVVNAVGLFREGPGQTFDALHRAAPVALFEACAAAGVARVVQISALGADDAARSAYHLSKRAADRVLAALPLSSAIAQPSLVHGAGGGSAALFGTLATLPIVPLPGDGSQRVQPIHVDDLVAALVTLVEARPDPGCAVVPLVGPEPVTLARYLAALRGGMGLPSTRQVTVPLPLVRAAARAAAHWPGALLDPEALDMLERGNVADPAPTAALLGRPARPVDAFVAPWEAAGMRASGRLGWIGPMLRASLAIVWFTAAFVSLFAWPVEDSLAMLERTGIPSALAPAALWGSSALDFAFGVLTLSPWAGRLLWLAQLALIAGYSAVIAWRLPEFWLHPFGPMVKNVPIVAILAALIALDPRRRSSRG